VIASEPSDRLPTSRRTLLRGTAVLGLSAASSLWARPAAAPAAPAASLLSASHLVTDYRPSQPTGWPPEQGRVRGGAGVTIGGHVATVPFTIQDTPYEISLLAFGQTASAPDPVYEPEPADPTIDFKATLEKAWGAYYSFRYLGGFSGRSAISVQSYNVEVIEQTATRLSYGADLFLVYEHDPSSSDPPISADLRWIEVSNSGGTSYTEFAQRANPYYFPGGLTSVYGKQAVSFYSAPEGGFAGSGSGTGSPALSAVSMAESFLVHDTGRKDHAGKGVIDIYGGVKWGWQVQPTQPS
jgi:hypothetical protein